MGLEDELGEDRGADMENGNGLSFWKASWKSWKPRQMLSRARERYYDPAVQRKEELGRNLTFDEMEDSAPHKAYAKILGTLGGGAPHTWQKSWEDQIGLPRGAVSRYNHYGLIFGTLQNVALGGGIGGLAALVSPEAGKEVAEWTTYLIAAGFASSPVRSYFGGKGYATPSLGGKSVIYSTGIYYPVWWAAKGLQKAGMPVDTFVRWLENPFKNPFAVADATAPDARPSHPDDYSGPTPAA